MSKPEFSYAITIHQKEKHLRGILDGLKTTMGPESHVYPNLDGCTDGSERIVDEWTKEHGLEDRVHKLYSPNVHEILSVKNIIDNVVHKNPNKKGFLIILQDDVILNEPMLEHNIPIVYDWIKTNYNLDIGHLSFRHGCNSFADPGWGGVFNQSALLESCSGIGFSNIPLRLGEVVERMVSVRSPECYSFDALRAIPGVDVNLAPYIYDCYDLSLQLRQAGFHNFIMGISTNSEPDHGSMRCMEQKDFDPVSKRNSHYMYTKWKKYLENPPIVYLPQPFYVPGVIIDEEEGKRLIERYRERRLRYFQGTVDI